MDKFLSYRPWISYAISFGIELEETSFDRESFHEQDSGNGRMLRMFVVSKGKGTSRKDNGAICGPYELTIFTSVREKDGNDGVRIEIRGCNFNGEQYGEQSHKKWIICEGMEMPVEEETLVLPK